MAFEGLSEKLQGVFKGLKGKGSLTEKDINDAMREVKLALLEADVNFKVVKEFVNSVKEKALGEEVIIPCMRCRAEKSIFPILTNTADICC